MVRRGAFALRANVELRASDGAGAAFAVTAGGRPAMGEVRLEYPDGERRVEGAAGEIPAFASLRRAVFGAPRAGQGRAVARELTVWVHRVTADGDSERLPAHAAVRSGGEVHEFELELSHGRLVLPLTDPSWRVEVTPATDPGD
jgi:hypothetical protein